MIRWFARNDIAANFLLVAILLLGGYSAFYRVPLEVNPSFDLQQVRVKVEYRGGTPQEVEKEVTVPIERGLQGLQGVKGTSSESRQDRADLRIEAEKGVNLQMLKDEVEARIEAIPTFPDQTERASVYVPNTEAWFEVIRVAVTGELSELELLRTAQQVENELLELPQISLTEIKGNRNLEISVEADDRVLRDYGLSLADLTAAIRRSSLSLSAGMIQTAAGGIRLRTDGQALTREEFQEIPLVASDGARLSLGDVATVVEGFEGDRELIRFNGMPSMMVEVMRTGDENAIQLADAVRGYVERSSSRYPEGVRLYAWDDESLRIKGRLGTLAASLGFGALLVLVVLGLFLRPMLAFWVVIGLPVSFAGGILLMPTFGVTANLMSVFGFIIVLGLVVDDAIVTGENIFTKLKEGLDPMEAAVLGTKEVAVPVTFGVITTVVAFIPMLFFEGFLGNFTRQIPPIVAGVLLFSLVESKLILPSHLKHLRVGRQKMNFFSRGQKKIADGLEWMVERFYRPMLRIAVGHRYVTLSIFVAMAFVTAGVWESGRLGYVALPKIESNRIQARVRMADETPVEKTDVRVALIAEAVWELQGELIDPGTGESLIEHIMTTSGRRGEKESGEVRAELLPEERRSVPGPSNEEIIEMWLAKVGEMNDVRSFVIYSERGGGRRGVDEGESIEIQLRGEGGEAKRQILEEVRSLLNREPEIRGVYDDSRSETDEYLIRLKPLASDLNLSQQELARQVRAYFYGDQAQRIQRGRDELRVMVRLPQEIRESAQTLEIINVRASDGTVVPLQEVATLDLIKAPGSITRIDGAESVTVSAQPDGAEVDILGLAARLEPRLDEIMDGYPGHTWIWDGFLREHEEEQRKKLISWVALLLTLYALLAIPFKSLLQPIIVLLAIPFGLIGALAGHAIMGVTPSGLSTFGMMALAGVVVNDSLVLVDYINRNRAKSGSALQAVLDSGVRRFRPILLTSLTTFVGLVPLMFDQSMQARFLVPMAISLGWGILFATFITLILIPAAYLVLEDLVRSVGRAKKWYFKPFREEG